MNTSEQWKSLKILGFSNYQISNLGCIANIKTRKILNGYYNGYGYIQVQLKGDDGKLHVLRRCRLVAIMFVENPAPQFKYEVDHIDCVRDNDTAENLQWVSHRENLWNPLTRQLISKRLKGRKLSEEHKKHISEALKGKKPGFSGMKHTEEAKALISQARKGKHVEYDEFGKKHYV